MAEFIERAQSHYVLGDMLEDVMNRIDGQKFFYTDDSHGHRYIIVDVTTPNMKK